MLLKQTILYLPAQFLGPVVQFLSVIVWTHWMSPEQFGELMLITATHELAYAVSLSWFSLYAVRYMPRREDGEARQRFYQTEASVLLLSSLVAAAAALLVLLFVFDRNVSVALLLVTVAYYVTRSINLHFSERVRADEQIGNYTLLQTIGPVLGFVLGLLFMAMFEASPLAVIAAYVVAQVLGLAVAGRRTELSFVATRPDGEMVRAAIGFGGPILVGSWLSWFSDHGIRFIVRYGIDIASVGLMSVAWGVGRRSTAFTTNFVSAAALPLAVKYLKNGNRQDAYTQIGLNGALLYGVLAPTLVGMWCINDILVRVVIDEQFQMVTMQLLPLAVLAGAVRNFRQHYADHVFLLEGRTDMFYIIDGFEAGAVLLFSIAGLLFGGLWGAVAGVTAGVIAGAFCGFGLALRHGLQIAYGHLARISLAAAVKGGVLQLVSLPVTGFGLATSILLGAVVYGLVLAPFYLRDFNSFLRDWRHSPAG
jgi:O-antigen/teichoic acid export membrane protein